MKPIIFAGVVVALVALAALRPRPLAQAAGDPGFAVVELFTSEGCSSCPPADELVAQIQREDKDRSVFILVWHVDYWDRLGWKDAFGSAAFTGRQREYANWLRLSSVYTPQIVVNGKKEFVGSDARALRATVENDLKDAATARLSIGSLQQDANGLSWSWQAGAVTKGVSLVVALVQRSAVTNVKAGENGGKTLTHVQIVRGMRVVDTDGKGSGTGKDGMACGTKGRGRGGRRIPAEQG
ncbi:DUF1223 domain-containing protein [Puia sp. P3]|uniref:DUF1223 domain-containing protein n=1 Tax=Puia sp. P3 TaxID=3423952 RepID=UPI003D66E6E0